MGRSTIPGGGFSVNEEANAAVSNLSETRAFLEQRQSKCIRFYSGLLPVSAVLGAAVAVAAFLEAPLWAASVVTGIAIVSVLAVLSAFLRERRIWRTRVSEIESVFHALADMPSEEQEKYLRLFAKIIRSGLEIYSLRIKDGVRLCLHDGKERYEFVLEGSDFLCDLKDGRQLCLPLE